MKDVLDESFLNDYAAKIFEVHAIDGEVYGVPFYVSPSLLFYNKDLFEKASFDPKQPP